MFIFIVYIFKEDFDVLKESVVRGVRGILFGQWMSIGNLVVYVIKGREDVKIVELCLYDLYRFCKIGEFYVVVGNFRERRDRFFLVYLS